jgi:hypothetical protein
MALPSEYDNLFWLAILHELDVAGGADIPANIYPRTRHTFLTLLTTVMSRQGFRW